MYLKRIEVKGFTYKLIVAENLDSWKEGLKGDKLNYCDGLIMVFPNQRIVNITMIGMIFPIDIVWLDQFKIVQKILPNVELKDSEGNTNWICGVESSFLIELRAGEIARLNLFVGEKLEF